MRPDAPMAPLNVLMCGTGEYTTGTPVPMGLSAIQPRE